jgi:hypothetical protein
MSARSSLAAIGVAAVVWCASLCAAPAPASNLSGSIGGWVTDSLGTPQMGAAVLLFNRSEKLLERALTNEAGGFLFASLRPDVYSIRVVLTSFIPALKRNIVVEPGARSLLSVSLSGVLSSIELVYSATGKGPVMSDEWKWVLRASSATRPVLRIRPRIDISDPSSKRKTSSSVFSGTRGVVRVSAGDQGNVSSLGNEPDLGTAFALATSVFGANQVSVSGNFGYSPASGVPAAGVSTRFSRNTPGGQGPEVKLTMRQLYLPARAGAAVVTGQEEAAPALRTMSIGFVDRATLTDDLRLEYGFSLDSVTFIDRLNYFSPFARLTYSQGSAGALDFAYSSGTPSADMLIAGKGHGAELQRDLTALSLFPRISLREGRARVQRSNNFEIGYRRAIGSRTYGLAVYHESVSNAALTMVAPAGAFPVLDLLPDMLSNSSVFNIGDYSSLGYMASLTQALGDRFSVSASYGSGGALTPLRYTLEANSADELRDVMRQGRRRWAMLAFTGTAPRAGTQFTTGYRWTDGRSLTPHHYYLTQSLRPDIGWSVYLRQPIPAFPGLPGRLEATADLRNLLAQGYLPLTTAQARRLYLMHTPRSVRGGLAFIF